MVTAPPGDPPALLGTGGLTDTKAVEDLDDTPGTYALELSLATGQRLQVGALGSRYFPGGRYVYVGSAWGPGGLRARLRRHLREEKRCHWHVDYLRAVSRPVGVWLAPSRRLECAWAQALRTTPGVRVTASGFGASDCGCSTHLFYFDELSLSTNLFPEAAYLSVAESSEEA
jgi:Uri superfamily endonuclease